MTPIIQISSPLHRRGVIPVCNRHQGEEDLLRSQGEREYQSVTGTKRRGKGAVVSHPFLGEVECSDESSFSEGGGPSAEPRGGGVSVCKRHQEEERGDCNESPFPRRGGTVMSYPFLGEGTPADSWAPPITAKGRRWGGGRLC